METHRSHADDRSAFSLRRTTVIALVVFMHGMLVLLLLAPAAPVRDAPQSRVRLRGQRRGWIHVFLTSGKKTARPRTPAATRRGLAQRRRPPPTRSTSPNPRAPVAMHRSRQPEPFALIQPNAADQGARASSETPPRYIPGSRAFQQRLQEALRRDRHQILPDNTVAGAPHFAMHDPRSTGVAGILHDLTHRFLGAQNPACVQAGTYMAMTDKQLATRYVSRSDVKQTIFEHRCVLKPASWMAPQGPATHLTARPPGHGIE